MGGSALSDLPYDVWRQILEYLDEGQARQMYCINRVLFDVALDLVYKSIYVGTPKLEKGRREISALHGNESMAKRTKELHITLSSLLLESDSPKVASKKFSFKRTKKAVNLNHPLDDTLMALPHLTLATKLVIEFHSDSKHYSSPIPRLFPTIWTDLGKRLAHVELTVPLEQLGGILPSEGADATLPHLATFSILFRMSYRSTDANAIIHKSVVPFINANSTTLVDLTCRTIEFSTDASALLLDLDYMPQLHRLEVVTNYTNPNAHEEGTYLAGHDKFLSAHRKQLVSLVLGFRLFSGNTSLMHPVGFDAIIGKSSCLKWLSMTSFSSLKSLKLRPFPFQMDTKLYDMIFHSTSAFIVGPTMSALTIQNGGNPISYHHCGLLANRAWDPEKPAKSALLQHLDLWVTCMSPNHIHLFLNTFPNLRYLRLRHRSIGPREDWLDILQDGESIGKTFSPAMKSFRFHDTFMKSVLQTLDHEPLPYNHDWTVEKAILENIPSVKFINKMSRAEILAQEPEPPKDHALQRIQALLASAHVTYDDN